LKKEKLSHARARRLQAYWQQVRRLDSKVREGAASKETIFLHALQSYVDAIHSLTYHALAWAKQE
jgi:hypothetical protein